MEVRTVTQSAKTMASAATAQKPVQIVELPRAANRPGGSRFGALVHADLASVPLNGDLSMIRHLTNVHGRILGASKEEIEAACEAVLIRPELIVLLGIAPDRPEVEFGWIEPGSLILNDGPWPLYRVARFQEKPRPAMAACRGQPRR